MIPNSLVSLDIQNGGNRGYNGKNSKSPNGGTYNPITQTIEQV